MTIRLNIYLIVGTIFLLLTWILVGIYRDDEFYEPNLFVKHRPTFKVNFHSPIGMQSIDLKDLGADDQLEEMAFQDFVVDRHQPNNSDAKLWFLPFILVQLTLTFLTLGIYKSIRTKIFKNWQLLTHLFVNLIVTSLCLIFILVFDKIFFSIILALLIMTINYGTIVLLTRQKSKA